MSTYERLVNSQKFFSPYLTQEDFSRFGRNSIETGYFIERVFPLFHTRFISISDDFDTINPNSTDNETACTFVSGL